jgi:hypothetical protein
MQVNCRSATTPSPLTATLSLHVLQIQRRWREQPHHGHQDAPRPCIIVQRNITTSAILSAVSGTMPNAAVPSPTPNSLASEVSVWRRNPPYRLTRMVPITKPKPWAELSELAHGIPLACRWLRDHVHPSRYLHEPQLVCHAQRGYVVPARAPHRNLPGLLRLLDHE